MGDFTSAFRKKLPKSAFAIPEKAPGSGSYPIPDLVHARDALARAGGKPVEARVRAAVHKKFPELAGKEGKADQADDKKRGIKEGSAQDEKLDSTITDVADAHKTVHKAQQDVQKKKKARYDKYPHMNPQNDPGTGKPYDYSKNTLMG